MKKATVIIMTKTSEIIIKAHPSILTYQRIRSEQHRNDEDAELVRSVCCIGLNCGHACYNDRRHDTDVDKQRHDYEDHVSRFTITCLHNLSHTKECRRINEQKNTSFSHDVIS